MKTGLSGYRGRQTTGSRGEAKMGGVDWMLEWRPQREGFPYSGDVGAELFRVSLPQTNVDDFRAGGWFAWAQLQVLRETYLGVRYEAAEEIRPPYLETRRVGIYAAYVPTDRLRWGLGFHRLTSDDPTIDGALTVLAEMSFAFGSKPRSAAWIHRTTPTTEAP